MPMERIWQFRMLEGWRIDYRALFDERAIDIWAYLLPDIPFNAERHRELCGMSIQPDFRQLPDMSALQRVIKELAHGKPL